MEHRLDSYISKYGNFSRRKAKTLIGSGQVFVNGKVCNNVVRVDSENDLVTVKGELLNPKKLSYRYIMLNKPLNVLSSVSDDRGRQTVVELVNCHEKLYPVGRLDFNSTGLILLTNDGDLALKLTHPRYRVPKKYIVYTEEQISTDQVQKLRNGVYISNTKTLPAKVKKLSNNCLEIVIEQGLKRQIREMCSAVNLTVISLERISIGNLNLGTLPVGAFRDLTDKELQNLKNLVN